MPSKGTKLTAEIARLRAQGLSDGQIGERLAIGKSIVCRNLYESRSKQRLSKLRLQAGLYSLKQVLVGCEVSWRWTETERLKQIEGTSTLTAENIGTIMRNQEKALEMAKAFLGKTFSPEDLARAEKKDDPLRKAREHLDAIQARSVSVQEG